MELGEQLVVYQKMLRTYKRHRHMYNEESWPKITQYGFCNYLSTKYSIAGRSLEQWLWFIFDYAKKHEFYVEDALWFDSVGPSRERIEFLRNMIKELKSELIK